MYTQRPPEQTEKTVSQILQNLKKREQESDEIELDYFQRHRLWAERQIRRIMAKIKQRDTGDLPRVPPTQDQTPDAFQIPPEQLQSVQPHQKTYSDGLPTQQLGNPDISMAETLIIRLSDTGGTPPIVPARLVPVDHQPRESFYTSGEALIYLIDHGVKAHEQQHQIAPDIVEMPQAVYDLLLKIEITEYVTMQRHIPFAVNSTLTTNTITNTIKCITY